MQSSQIPPMRRRQLRDPLFSMHRVCNGKAWVVSRGGGENQSTDSGESFSIEKYQHLHARHLLKKQQFKYALKCSEYKYRNSRMETGLEWLPVLSLYSGFMVSLGWREGETQPHCLGCLTCVGGGTSSIRNCFSESGSSLH